MLSLTPLVCRVLKPSFWLMLSLVTQSGAKAKMFSLNLEARVFFMSLLRISVMSLWFGWSGLVVLRRNWRDIGL